MNCRRAQAALEFLTTYAWAFLVILTTISALYYFGVFDFSKYLPQKCTFTSQFPCIDFSMKSSDSTIRFRLSNNIGEDIIVDALELTNDFDTPLSCTAPTTPISWNAGDVKDFIFSDCQDGGFMKGERTEAKIAFTYHSINTPSQPQHTLKGKIIGIIG